MDQAHESRLSRAASLMRPSALREMLASAEPPRLSLAGGLPPSEAFPFEELSAIVAGLLDAHDPRALQYTSAEGDPRLRSQIGEMLGVRPSRVVVLTGSQQGIDLAARVLLDPGDVAVVEKPAYVGALRSIVPTGARVVGIRCDEEGMVVDDLAALLAQGVRPKLCYLCANFSNPHGATLSAARRHELAQLSAEHGFVIVEDDQYGRLRFAGAHLPTIASLADEGMGSGWWFAPAPAPSTVVPGADVLYLSGFSKVVAPGLRVGFAVAPEWLVRPLVLAKQATDLAASSLAQATISRLLDDREWWASHFERLRGIYATRAGALVEAADAQLAGRLQVRRPEGGMFVWSEIVAPGIDAPALIAACRRRGLALVPGSEFTVDTDGAFDRSLRLSYSTLTPDELREAVGLMALAFDDLSRRGAP